MTDAKDKLVDLEDLKVLSGDTAAKLGGKLAVPLNEGTQGQVLTAKGDGTSEWRNAQVGLSLGENMILVDHNNVPVEEFYIVSGQNEFGVNYSEMFCKKITDMRKLGFEVVNDAKSTVVKVASETPASGPVTDSASCSMIINDAINKEVFQVRRFSAGPRSLSNERVVELGFIQSYPTLKSSDQINVDINGSTFGYLAPYEKALGEPSLVKPDGVTTDVPNDDGVLSVKDAGITMSHLAQDVKDAIAGAGSTIDEAAVRAIVNEQLAKMKFTVNDQGHLIIETPEA